MGLKNWKFVVESTDLTFRLDQLLSQKTGMSRREARKVLAMGGVQVDRKRVRVASRILRLGQDVRVSVDDSLGEPPDLEIEVIYEDEVLLVVNKPAGIPTQGTQASDRHDLLAMLNRQRPKDQLFLCHRLDQGTSGLLVLAKGKGGDLGRQFQERTLQKLYLARVSEAVAECVVDAPIGRLRLATPARYGCSGDLIEAKPSRTSFRPATAEEKAGLRGEHWLVCELHTGRTHQIRVHLASLGTPVLGDGLYSGMPDAQMWLHAWKMKVAHPLTGVVMEWTAPPSRFWVPKGDDA